MNFLLVGTGYMAEEYLRSLKMLRIDVTAIGNSESSCDKFEKLHKIKTYSGGLANNIEIVDEFTHIIIATPVALLNDHLDLIIDKTSIENILIEKPGGLDIERLKKVSKKICNTTRQVFVAYNRRFYQSVKHAQKIIEEDQGVTSFYFNVSELVHTIDMNKFSKDVLSNWFLANTSHVVDTAFFLGGQIKHIEARTAKGISWNKNETGIYVGHGMCSNDTLFSYNGDWTSASRWSIEIFTKKHSLLFCPLETLQIRNKGEVKYTNVNLVEDGCKEGVTSMIEAFIQKSEDLPNIDEQIWNIENIYNKIDI